MTAMPLSDHRTFSPSVGKGAQRINVIQGDYAVSGNAGDVLTTVLGSCVATCLFDPVAKIGGLNHFLLPGENNETSCSSESYGLNAMELLINSLLKQGGKRNRLKAKIFGGARMIRGLSVVGKQNGAFATEFLAFEGIPCVSKSLGGDLARRLRFWPTTGRVQMKYIADIASVAVAIPKKPMPVEARGASNLEIF
ncbi:hypothetical protein N9W89_14650 [Hellea sp.]|nr:hypothetical protein [Hellea sp.]